IAANTHRFCDECNRMRLTSTGFLKPCLCYDSGIDLKAVLRGGSGDSLTAALTRAVKSKPQGHCFSHIGEITENKTMNRIGG
ncbi:MAG: cyclic pyranopterin phosphate synthase MoaA, partial [Megasphaera micronuciformis]|nr:cyclic pyranopterin phosphate synthase MoaA [Megasphaera micronuciformis]